MFLKIFCNAYERFEASMWVMQVMGGVSQAVGNSNYPNQHFNAKEPHILGISCHDIQIVYCKL